MKKLSCPWLIILITLSLHSCKSQERDKFTQTYISALSIGDLLEVEIDTASLTYKYKVLDGDWKGTPFETGSGTLIPTPDINHSSYVTDKGYTSVAIKDEVALGVVPGVDGHLDFFVGVPQRKQVFSIKDIAGVYNYVSYSPRGIFNPELGHKVPWDKISFGTLLLDERETWAVLHRGDLKTSNAKPTIKGSFIDLGNGVIELMGEDGNKFAHVMVRYEPAGDHFAVIDLVHNNFKGIAFGGRQLSIANTDVEGNSFALLTDADKTFKCLTQGNRVTIVNDSINYDLTFNAPWPGMLQGQVPTQYGDYYQFFGIASKRSGSIYGVHMRKKADGVIVDQQGFISVKDR